jgi:hypothetical protein
MSLDSRLPTTLRQRSSKPALLHIAYVSRKAGQICHTLGLAAHAKLFSPVWRRPSSSASRGERRQKGEELVEIKGQMWGMAMVREESLLVLRTGEDSGPIRFSGGPRDTGAQLAEVRQRTETLH